MLSKYHESKYYENFDFKRGQKSNANAFIVVFVAIIINVKMKKKCSMDDEEGCMTSAHTQHQYIYVQAYGRILKKIILYDGLFFASSSFSLTFDF